MDPTHPLLQFDLPGEALFQQLLEAAPDAMVIIDHQGRIVLVNAQTEACFGYRRDELIGQPVEVLMPVRLRGAHAGYRAAYVSAPRTRPMGAGLALYGQRRDGTEFPVEISLSPLETAAGLLVISAVRDVTVQKRAQETLQAQAHLLDLTHDTIIVRDGASIIRFWNYGAEQTYGWSREEAIGAPSHVLLRTEFPVPRAEIEAQLLETGRWEGQLTHTTRDGRRIVVASRWALARDAHGTPVATMEINNDITAQVEAQTALRQVNQALERRVAERTADLRASEEGLRLLAASLEQRVQERTKQLAEANEELEAFAYTVAHDLRAPLRGIQGFAEALQEDYAATLHAQGQDYLARILRGATRLETLIDNLLAYSRLGHEDISVQPVALRAVIDTVLSELAGDIQATGASITVEAPLPAVLAHRQTLVQVVTNLIANAIKFTPPDTVPVVVIRAEPRATSVRVWVEDNGLGIAPEHQERIFRAFERLHGSDTYPGTGIGLAIVRRGVERMGGTVGLESEPGQGSQFWFELPVVQPA
jgi:PAS domain S-box-containing protein